MQIIPLAFLEKIQLEKNLNKEVLDIESKLENVIAKQTPIFFPEYTDHGINHFIDTLKMAAHLIDLDYMEKHKGQTPVLNHLSSLDITVLIYSILLHDFGMHIHFKGFKQLIGGYYDDVRVDFFDELTWKKEWENFMIEAKRFSGRERINIFGDEQVIINEIDFSKNVIDSDIQKLLIGEFIRRNHGRLAHEIALKGFPIQGEEVLEIGSGLNRDYKDLIGLISRSHSMSVRNAMTYVDFKFPDDPNSPHNIEIPFLMCVLRIADYFQFDSTRTNSFLIKIKSFTSPFSLLEHKTHLATEYFKTDDKDPETLLVNLKPTDGLMYNKLIELFDDIQRELDTSFAITGETYGRHKDYLKLRYRRIKTNLKNKKVINQLSYVVGRHKFEADTDLFKLLVGPLYGYDPSFGVREVLQNAIDACVELKHKVKAEYLPEINIHVKKIAEEFFFVINDNGKGMNMSEIKNYFLKAGSSFRNSMEWKIDFQNEANVPSIRRTGKFGIGVLASFLIGDSIEVTTKRYNESSGFKFNANLTNEFIEILKDANSNIGTEIIIKITEETYNIFKTDIKRLTKWYMLNFPKVNFYIDDLQIQDNELKIDVIDEKQFLEDSIRLNYTNFDDIIWRYPTQDNNYIAINGIKVPGKYFYPTPYSYYNTPDKKQTVYDELKNFPFISILDRNNLIDLELSRNSIRGHLPFINELVESCKLDYLYKLLFFTPPVVESTLNFSDSKYKRTPNDGYILEVDSPQFDLKKIYTTDHGYFLNTSFYNPVRQKANHYNIYSNYKKSQSIKLLENSTYTLYNISGKNDERNIIRGDYNSYVTISKPDVFLKNHESTTITKSVRDNLQIIEKTDLYILYKRGENISYDDKHLKQLFNENDVIAIQITNRALPQYEKVNKLLKEHFFEPKLIPINYEQKIIYARTLSEKLQKHIIEERNIKLY